MTFLPIVERELRVASRRKSTFRTRQVAAWIAFVVCFFLFLGADLTATQAAAGARFFSILGVIAFGFCLIAGLFFTADCIGEELRDGTMGFLFLTDLKSYDVLTGKFVAASLNAFYGLMAIFPALALPLMVGGVTAGEFWRLILVLLTTLFLSLSIGLMMSTLVREQMPALICTFFLLLILAWAVFPVDEALRWYHLCGDGPLLALASPLEMFSHVWEQHYFREPELFWETWGASGLLGALCVAAASWLLPRKWQDNPSTGANPWLAAFRDAGRAVTSQRKMATRVRLLDLNPVAWLVRAKYRESFLVWFTLLVAGAGGYVFSHAGHKEYRPVVLFIVLPVILQLFIAVASTRFFVNARRSGAMELLLTTPLHEREIIRGHWLALRRAFFWPVITLLGLQLWSVFSNVIHFGRSDDLIISASLQSYYLVRCAIDFVATGWVGMWFGLSTKKPGLAFAKTLLFVLLLPWVLFCLPNLVVTLPLMASARHNLEENLRALANQQDHLRSAFEDWERLCKDDGIPQAEAGT